MEAFIRAMERRHEEGLPLDRHSVASFFVSRVDTEVDKRLEALGPQRPRRAAPGWPTPAPPTRRSSACSAASASPPCARPAPGAAPAVGLDRRQEPRLPETMYVYGLVGPRHGQHDAAGHADRRDRRGRGDRRHRRRRPGRRPRRAARRRDRPRRRHRQAAARRHRRVRGADEQAARRHRGQARGDRHRPPATRSRPTSRPSSSRPVAGARSAAPPRRTSCAASGAATARCGRPRARPS